MLCEKEGFLMVLGSETRGGEVLISVPAVLAPQHAGIETGLG